MNFWCRFQVKKSVKILVITMARTQTISNTESEIFHLFLGCQIIFIFMAQLVILQWKPKNTILALSNQERYIHITQIFPHIFMHEFREVHECNQIRKLCQICSWSYWTTNISIKMLEGKFKYNVVKEITSQRTAVLDGRCKMLPPNSISRLFLLTDREIEPLLDQNSTLSSPFRHFTCR